MMNLMNTKPVWLPNAIATERGWVNPKNGELAVAIPQLKSLLDAQSSPMYNEYHIEVGEVKGPQTLGEVVERIGDVLSDSPNELLETKQPKKNKKKAL